MHIVDQMKLYLKNLNLNIDSQKKIYKKKNTKRNNSYEIDKFKSRMKSLTDKRNINKDPTIVKKEMIIINDFTEIDNLDKGKPWKRLDNWMRKKCINEYITRNNLDEHHKNAILNLFQNGEFKATANVDYDAVEGKISKLKSKKLNLLLESQ